MAASADEFADFTEIRAEAGDGIGWLTLNRPERRNALSPTMLAEIVSCLRTWSLGNQVKVVVIGAEGKSFCAGIDRDWIQSESAEKRREIQFASSRFHRELFGLRIPTIAMMHGHAMGTGMDVGVLCDLRIASEDATFGHPEITAGGPPLYGPLRQLVGDGWARELCLTGRTVDAAEAARVGLVNHVVERSQLRAKASELATQIARAPLTALVTTKTFFRSNYGIDDFIDAQHDNLFESGLLFHEDR
jgi:enoyl-CoA hydratase